MTRVLLVDDDESILEIAKHILESKYYLKVDTSNSVEDALSRLVSREYDAIVSDYAMPEYTGFDLFRAIRDQGNTIPFILFSIRDREDMVIEAFNMGVSFYVQKDKLPNVAFADLAHKITQAVEHSRAEKILHVQRDLAIGCTSTKDLDVILSTCIKAGTMITGMNNGAIYLKDKNDNHLYLALFHGFMNSYAGKEIQEMLITSVTNTIKKHSPVFYDRSQTQNSTVYITYPGLQFQAEMFLPIIHQGACIGLVHLATEDDSYQITPDIRYHLESTVVQMASHIADWQNQNALIESEQHMSTLLGNLPGMAYRCKHDNVRTMDFVSEGCLSLTGYSSHDLIGNNTVAYADLIDPKDKTHVLSIISEAIVKKSQFKLMYRITTHNGVKHWVQELGRGTYLSDGTLNSVEGFISDFTKEKKLNDTLKTSENRLKLLFTNMNSGAAIFTIDKPKKDLILIEINSAAEKIERKSRDDLIGKSFFDIFANPSAKELQTAAYQIIEDGKPQYLARIPFSYGSKYNWREAYLYSASSHLGKEIFLLYNDITDRIIFEQQTIASLREKELLLKEVHHRVKNNLQIISGILKLQLYTEGEQDIKEIIQNCRNQVYSMAAIHEKLYNATNISKIHIKTYIEDLVDYLNQEYAGITNTITFNVDCDPDIYLDIDTCIPCGLILNETITNAVKYAFPHETNNKEIVVRFNKKSESYVMQIADNGIGMDDIAAVNAKKSLGMELLRRLSRQLRGNATIDGMNGTTITITFPISNRR